MKSTLLIALLAIVAYISSYGQTLPPKQAYPFDVKQIHSGHSLTDPLFGQPWPGQFVNLVTHLRGTWAGDDIGKSTVPGSTQQWRWEHKVEYGPDARRDIENWELLCITERVALAYEGGNMQQWYIDLIRDQKEYLSLFVNNAWNNGNYGNGAATLLWTTWTNIDDSDGPWRDMLDIQGKEFENMQDYANANKPDVAPYVYIIPGHKMMSKLYDDIRDGLVPGITHINQFFSDNIHTNSLGAYAVAMIHYACIFNLSPVGLPNNLMPDVPGFHAPTSELALYLQEMIWDVVTTYPRTGITKTTGTDNHFAKDGSIVVYPNPAINQINFSVQTNVLLTTITGQIMTDRKDINTLDISGLLPGIYFLTLTNDLGQVLKRSKIVKE